MRIEFSVRYQHSVERVFPYLAEPEKWLEYVPALVERTRIDPGPLGPGSRWRSVDRVGPFRVHFVDELVALEPDRRVEFRQSAPWNSRVEYRVDPDGGATIVHVEFTASPSGRVAWLGLMPDALATRIFRRDMEGLATVLAATDAA
jgi:uncharacterized protein YndB with AHSA1/START domain